MCSCAALEVNGLHAHPTSLTKSATIDFLITGGALRCSLRCEVLPRTDSTGTEFKLLALAVVFEAFMHQIYGVKY